MQCHGGRDRAWYSVLEGLRIMEKKGEPRTGRSRPEPDGERVASSFLGKRRARGREGGSVP